MLVKTFNTWGPMARAVGQPNSDSKLSWRSYVHLWRIKFTRLRFYSALMPTLMEFQEVQGFFIAAVQIATLATFHSSTAPSSLSLESVSSIGEAVLNTQMVQVLAVNSVLPVLLVQILLQRAGMRSWYTLSITILVLALAVPIRGSSLVPDFDALWAHFQQTAPVPACGGNPSPRAYCQQGVERVDSAVPLILLAIPVADITILFLLIDQAAWSWMPILLSRRRAEWEKALQTLAGRYARVRYFLGLMHGLVWAALQLLLVSCIFQHLLYLVDITTGVGKGNYEWTYGQLVSVTLWAPIAAKYVYCNVCKLAFHGSMPPGQHSKADMMQMELRLALRYG